MITAGLVHERAVRAINKDVLNKINIAVEEAAAKGKLETTITLNDDECCDALVDELRTTYNYKVIVRYCDVISNDGLLKMSMKLEW